MGRRDRKPGSPEDIFTSFQTTSTRVRVDGVRPVSPAQSAEELARAKAEKDAVAERERRARADLDNLRKRAERERERLESSSTGKVLRELSPVFDNLHRAVQAAEAAGDPATESLLRGLHLVRSDLERAFERLDVESFAKAGESFDPVRHDAIAVADGGAHLEIAEVVSPGLRIGEQIVKPAQVVVFRGA